MAIVFLAAFVGMFALVWGLATGASVQSALMWYSLSGAVTVLLLAWLTYRRKTRRRNPSDARPQPGSSEANSSQ
jgi:membrane protein implicated in regulation of membrane protease activity